MSNQSIKIVVTRHILAHLSNRYTEHFKKLLSPENMSFRSSTGEVDKQFEILKKILVENKPTVFNSHINVSKS